MSMGDETITEKVRRPATPAAQRLGHWTCCNHSIGIGEAASEAIPDIIALTRHTRFQQGNAI
jgi:hypothetical protein